MRFYGPCSSKGCPNSVRLPHSGKWLCKSCTLEERIAAIKAANAARAKLGESA